MSEPNGKFVSNEQARATTAIVGIILLGIALGIAYWIWPEGITDLPLGAITLGQFLRAGAAIVVAFIPLSFLLGVILDI